MTDKEIEILKEGFRFGFAIRKFCEDRLESRGESSSDIMSECIFALKEIANSESTMIESDADAQLANQDSRFFSEETFEEYLKGQRKVRRNDFNTAKILAKALKV